MLGFGSDFAGAGPEACRVSSASGAWAKALIRAPELALDTQFYPPVSQAKLADLVSELTDEASLLLDFAESTGLVGFARFALPLGKRPVVVPSSVDGEDLGAAVPSRPQDHASCSTDELDRPHSFTSLHG